MIMSIITLHVNGLSIQIRSQKLSDWMQNKIKMYITYKRNISALGHKYWKQKVKKKKDTLKTLTKSK